MYRGSGRSTPYRTGDGHYERNFLVVEGVSATQTPTPSHSHDYNFDPNDPRSNQMKTLELLQKTLEENVQLKAHVKHLEQSSQHVGGDSSKKLSSLSSQNQELSERLIDERKNSRRLQTENEELRRELTHATQVNQDLKIEVDELKSKIHRLELEGQARLEEELRTIRQAHRSEHHELASKMQSQERSWGDERKKLLEERDQYSLKCESLKAEAMDSRGEAKKAKEEKQVLEETVEKMKTDIELLTKRIGQLTTQAIMLAENRNQTQIAPDKVEALNQEIRTLKQKLREKASSQSMSSTQMEFQILLRDKKDTEAKLASMIKKLQQKESRVEYLERELGVRNEFFANYKQEMSAFKLQLESEQMQKDSLHQELKRCYETIRDIAHTPGTKPTEAFTKETGTDEYSYRGRPVPYSDYLQVKRECAVLKTQLAEARKIRNPNTNSMAFGQVGARSTSFGAERSLANLGKEIEELMQSLPEIATVQQAPSPGRPKSGASYGAKKKS